jgi:hypothetical protein
VSVISQETAENAECVKDLSLESADSLDFDHGC